MKVGKWRIKERMKEKTNGMKENIGTMEII
jgi:hypothetical protein